LQNEKSYMYSPKQLRHICKKRYLDHKGFLYIMSSIKQENIYKVGYTRDIDQRYKNLKMEQAIDKCIFYTETKYVKRSEAIVKHLIHGYNIGYCHTTLHREWFYAQKAFLEKIIKKVIYYVNKYTKKNKKILYDRITDNKIIMNLLINQQNKNKQKICAHMYNALTIKMLRKICNKNGYMLLKKNKYYSI
jgi:hypothetical protein